MIELQPEPLNISKADVEEFTREIADIVNFNAGDDIHQLVRKLGGEIYVSSLNDNEIQGGSIVAKEIDNFSIYLSPLTSVTRDRFTIAHELGHLFLHLPSIKAKGGVMCANRFVEPANRSQNRAETEANWFAAELLMPKDEFVRIVNSSSGPELLNVLKMHFDVSASAIQVRAKNLGCNI